MKIKEKSFEILKTGNFYFPVKDMDKKFIVHDIVDFEIDKKEFAFIDLERKHKSMHFGSYADPIWSEIKKFLKKNKQYRNCWFVPTLMHEFRDKVSVSVDILKPVRR